VVGGLRGALLAAGAVALLGAACVAAPRSYDSERSLALESVDYSGWDELLRAHVRDGVVGYSGFAGTPELADFLAQLRDARPTEHTREAQRLAFLINAYNAFAISAILAGGSPETLLGRHRFFQRELHSVAGEQITLWDLEHQRIRPLGEPRIHFALVCGSASCPKLASEAYLPERLDDQLERDTLAFVNDPTRNRFDAAARVARVSAIFDWYAEDFEVESGSVAAYLAAYVSDPAIVPGLTGGSWRIEPLDYDWRLNGSPPAH